MPAQPLFLIYRAAPAAIGQRDTVSALICGDHSGVALHLRLIASNGQAAHESAVIRGSDGDAEPTWPQWISAPIVLNFRGWKKFDLPVSSFAYRAPIGESASGAPPVSSVDAFGIDMPDTGETVLLDNLIWESAAPGLDPIVVDDFERGNYAAWQQHGTPETTRDAQVALVTDRAKVAAGRISFSVSFAIAKRARMDQLAQMHAAMVSLGSTYLTYVPASPFRRILPSSVPEPGEITRAIQLFACPGQSEPGSFCIYSDTGMANVSVAPANDLQQFGHKIDASNIDVRVVKVWTRQGTGEYRDPDAAGPTPELLVKDDRIPLDIANGVLPTIPLTGDPITTIPARTAKQFWVTVHVPKDASPGSYSTQLAIHGSGIAHGSVTLLVDVLPLQLYDASKQYVIDPDCRETQDSSTSTDAGGEPTESLDSDTFTAELADAHDHGFLFGTLMDAPDSLWNAYQAYKAALLATPLIYDGLTGAPDQDMAASDEIESQRHTAGVDSVAYIAPAGTETVDELTALHKARRTTAAFVRTADQFDAEQSVLDMPIYSVDEPYVQQLLRTSGARTSDKYDYWFWPAYENDPQADRLYAGYLLYRANLYGAYVPNYEPPFSADPYAGSPPPGEAPDEARLNTAMLMYPVQGGVIDTVQWESVQAGINDMRYLTTYFAALRECKDNHVAKDLVASSEPQVKAMMGKAFWVMDDTQYQKARRAIAHDAVLLREALNAFYAHGGGNPANANASTEQPPVHKASASKPS
jgi:hypothetical protein